MSDRGQAIVEYGLLLFVISLGTLIALLFLRDQLVRVFSDIGNALR